MPGNQEDYNDSVQDSKNNLQTDYTASVADSNQDSALVQNLQDSFDLSHLDLDLLTSEERLAEIKRCQGIQTQYMRMMYFISSNSGYFSYTDSISYFYISETLKRPSQDMASFNYYSGLPWSIKPVYGWISDSIYPFKYRFKPYIIFLCLMHIAS